MIAKEAVSAVYWAVAAIAVAAVLCLVIAAWA